MQPVDATKHVHSLHGDRSVSVMPNLLVPASVISFCPRLSERLRAMPPVAPVEAWLDCAGERETVADLQPCSRGSVPRPTGPRGLYGNPQTNRKGPRAAYRGCPAANDEVMGLDAKLGRVLRGRWYAGSGVHRKVTKPSLPTRKGGTFSGTVWS